MGSLLFTRVRSLCCPLWLCLGLLLARGSCYADTLFEPAVTYLGVGEPTAVAVVDLNGDGHLDVASVSGDTTAMAINLGNGDGTLGPRHLEYGEGLILDIAVGNVNGDASPDLIVPTDQSVLLYYGAGDGTFPTFDQIYFVGDLYQYVAVGDFNNDTYTDIAVSRASNPGQIVVLNSKGDGTYNAPVAYATYPGPRKVVASDLNGDGKLDLIVANYGYQTLIQNSVSVFLGVGDGTFGARTDFGTSLQPLAVTVGDFNGDAKPDIAACTAFGKISVLLGTGAGTFGAPTDYNVADVLGGITNGDFDGDGDMDLAVAAVGPSFVPGFVSVLQNDGSGTFGGRVDYPTGIFTACIVPADLNEDQRSDLVTASGQSYEGVSVYLNCVPCTPTAIEAALLDSHVEPGLIRLTWSVSEPSGTYVTVERREAETGWAAVSAASPLLGGVYTYTDAAVEGGHRYAYRLRVESPNETIVTGEFWVQAATEDAVPRVLTMSSPSPNPASSAARIRLALPADAELLLTIFDARGRLVSRALDGIQTKGWHDFLWNGRDGAGRTVASGVYYLRLEAAGQTVTRRLVVAR